MKVLIAGGGVGGTATALALEQQGIPSVIYEAHAAGGDDAGAFLTVMANGMAALDAIGAGPALLEASYPATAVSLIDARGRQLGNRPIDGVARTLTRAALYRVLQEVARQRGIPVVHGKRLVDATADGGVELRFADGSVASGDLLVGADGVRSVTRSLIDPQAPAPRYTGERVVYGYADGNPGDGEPAAYQMVFGSRAFFGSTRPGDGRTWWFTRIRADPLDGPADWRAMALEAARGDATPAAAIIEATRAEDVVGGNSYDIPSLPRWHGERMVLVGDAAHAASPAAAQGASMALEDAVELAAALAREPGPAEAFAAYQAVRRPRTEETVVAAARMAGVQHDG